MRLIIISPPESLRDEPVQVAHMLEQLPVTVHLRKPGQDTTRIAHYLDQIPAGLHPCIMVHSHSELLSRFNLKGIHFTEKDRLDRLPHIRRLRQRRLAGCLSSAFHQIPDIPDGDGLFDYIFLSPIFDSISKVGYQAAFDHDGLKNYLSQTDQSIIALGGINEMRLPLAAALGFSGVAVLGAVWQASDPVAAAVGLWEICHDIMSFKVKER